MIKSPKTGALAVGIVTSASVNQTYVDAIYQGSSLIWPGP
jgi:hypothetical protein